LLILKHVTAGDNEYGQLGLGDTEARGDTDDRTKQLDYGAWDFETGYYAYTNDPIEMGDFLPAVSLGTGLTATAITCGSEHTCALLSNGLLKCWGECRFPPFPS